MKLKNLKRAAYFALLGASVAVGAVTAKVPSPPPKVPGDITYYSNASMTVEVGREIVMCNGGSYMVYGYATNYKQQDVWYCPPVPIE